MAGKDGYEYADDAEYEDEDEDVEIEEGLTREESKKEAEARSKYFKMVGMIAFLIGPILAWSTYFLTKLNEDQASLYKKKFELIYENQLGYVYLSFFILYLTRAYVMINSNGARAATTCERPDQHCYVGTSDRGTSKVTMATTGVEGRFNRAQRALYNMDESLPLFGVALVIAGFVFGPVMLLPALLSLAGRVTFANGYKKSLTSRSQGFMMGAVAEGYTHALVGMIAIKGIFGALIPF